jgi:tRNA dimethylallyltransferase
VEPLFREPEIGKDRRDRLREWLAQRSTIELARWVRVLDPHHAGVAETGGPHRLSRTAEVPLLTGRPISWWHREGAPEDEALDVKVVLVERPREELYERIDTRTRWMFEGGLLEEVERLLASGCTVDDPGMTGVGYREAAAVLAGELTPEEAVDRAQRATRAYARRQLTWFRNQLPEPALRIDAGASLGEQVDEIVQWWKRTGAKERGVGRA